MLIAGGGGGTGVVAGGGSGTGVVAGSGSGTGVVAGGGSGTGVGSALAARTAALAASGERANTSAPGEPSRSTFGLRSHSGSRMLACWPFAWPLLPASSTGPCFVNELLLPCVYARFGVVAVRAVAAGAVAARRGGSSASSTKKESGGGGGHRLPAIGRERTATSVSRHSAARGRAAKGERHSVSPRGHRSRTQVVPVHTWQRAQPRRAARRTHALGAQPLVVARARTLSQRFEARLPFRMQSRMQSRMQGRAPSRSASKHGSHFEATGPAAVMCFVSRSSF